MAAPVVKPIIRKTRTFNSVKELQAFGVEGVRAFGTQVLLEANQIEVRKNPPNEPTAIEFNRRATRLTDKQAERLSQLSPGSSVIAGTWRRIGFTYGRLADIFEAVVAVYSDLRGLTRRDTGTGVSTYYFYGKNVDNPSGSRVLRSLSQVQTWLEANQGGQVTISILGPTVVYRRKLIYNPRGGALQGKGERSALIKRGRALSARTRGTAVDRIIGFNEKDAGLRFRSVGKKGRVVAEFNIQQALHRIVLRRNQLRFRGKAIWMSYGFVPSKEALPPDPRTGRKYGLGPGPYGNIPVMFIGASTRRR